jgi:hypothetical protein
VNEEKFDDFARTLASGVSRRRALRLLGGGVAVSLGALVGVGRARAAPSSCSVFCANLSGPQKAACKQACRACGGDVSRVCSQPAPGGGAAQFVCCPEGTVCDPTGACV